MGALIGGGLLILYTVVVRVSMARSLCDDGRPTVTWRYLAIAPNLWVGLSVLLYGFAPRAGGFFFALVLIVWIVLLCRATYLGGRAHQGRATR